MPVCPPEVRQSANAVADKALSRNDTVRQVGRDLMRGVAAAPAASPEPVIMVHFPQSWQKRIAVLNRDDLQ